MAQELLKHTLLHDLRGNATALLGWQTLIQPSSQKAAGGIERSVKALLETIRAYSYTATEASLERADIGEICARLGISFGGETSLVVVSPKRMEAALSLALPTRVEIQRERSGRCGLLLSGLEEEGLALLSAPHSKRLVEVVQDGGRLLGACLFKEVVRGVRGEYEISADRGQLTLFLEPWPQIGV